MMAAIVGLSAGFTSCSKDDDGGEPDSDKISNKNMTGWIELDGTKYSLNYVYEIPFDGSDAYSHSDICLFAASVDIDSKSLYKGYFNIASMNFTVNNDGTIDFDVEFNKDFSYTDDSREVGYDAYHPHATATNITFEKEGDSYKIEGKDITFEVFDTHTNLDGTQVKGSFLFNGKPRKLKNITIS